MNLFQKKYLLMFFFLSYLSVVLLLTLFTHNYYTYGRSENLKIFSSLALMIRSGSLALIFKNVIGNMLLFLPFGLLLPLLSKPAGRYPLLILSAFLFSLFIESSQYLFASRIFDIDDMWLNITGAVIGRMIFSFLLFVRRHFIIFYSKE